MERELEPMNIMIVGVGGQGTLLTSRIIGDVAVKAGLDVKVSEVHGMAQRGGSVVTFVRYGKSVSEPIVEYGEADLLIAFEELEALRYQDYLKQAGVMIVDQRQIDPISVLTGKMEYPQQIIEKLRKKYQVEVIEAQSLANRCGDRRCSNCVMLGAAARYLPFVEETWLKAILDVTPSKYVLVNQDAFMKGFISVGRR